MKHEEAPSTNPKLKDCKEPKEIKLQSYQREASVNAQYADIDGASMVGDTNAALLGHVLCVVVVNDAAEATHQRAEGHRVERDAEAAPQAAGRQDAYQGRRYQHCECLGQLSLLSLNRFTILVYFFPKTWEFHKEMCLGLCYS